MYIIKFCTLHTGNVVDVVVSHVIFFSSRIVTLKFQCYRVLRTSNLNMTEYIPFRLHIQRRGYKLNGIISISIHSN